MTKVSAAQIIGGDSSTGRQKNDFYRTPCEAVIALLRQYPNLPESIWEPCCGDGAISKVLEDYGKKVISSDLFDRGYGTPGIDLLKVRERQSDTLITNPPFNIADQIIEKSMDIGVNFIALLLKQTYWNTQKRTPLFLKHRPAVIHTLNWRLDFLGLKSPAMDCMWCVWDGTATETKFEIMRKPR